MTLERTNAHLFRMDGATWLRHANPWAMNEADSSNGVFCIAKLNRYSCEKNEPHIRVLLADFAFSYSLPCIDVSKSLIILLRTYIW